MRNAISIALLALAFNAAATAQEPKKDDAKTLAKELNDAFAAQDWKKTVEVGRKVTAAEPKNALAWHHLGYALHVQGMLDEAIVAHKAASELPQTKPHGFYNLACAYALKKDANAAVEALEKAVAAGFSDLAQLEQDGDFASVREDARFKKVVEALKKAPKKRRAFVNPGERKSTRVAFFGGSGVQQAALSYGAPAWKDEYAAVVDAGKVDGKRWRLGVDFWTTFDTDVEMTVGGKTLAPGLYYLTLERTAKGEYVLAFNDAVEIRKLRIDAFMCEKTKGGVEVAMKSSKAETNAESLKIEFEVNQADQVAGDLTIAYGPYRLSVPYSMKIEI